MPDKTKTPAIEDTPPEPDLLTVALAYRELELTDNHGGLHQMRVYVLPARLAEAYLREVVEGNIQSVAALACQRKVTYLDQFPPQAQRQLYDLAEELNFTHCEAALDRRHSQALKALPLLRKGLGAVVGTLAEEVSSMVIRQMRSAMPSEGSSSRSAQPAEAALRSEPN